MSAMHPSRGWKGCAMCKFHKVRGHGRRVRDPFNVQRQLGETRRYDRDSVSALWAEDWDSPEDAVYDE